MFCSQEGLPREEPLDQELAIHTQNPLTCSSLEPLLPQAMPTGSIATVPTPRGPVLKFKRLTGHAFAPTKGSEMAAGYDLKSAYNVIVPAEGTVLVKQIFNSNSHLVVMDVWLPGQV